MSQVTIDVKVVAQQALSELKKISGSLEDTQNAANNAATSVNKFGDQLENVKKLAVAGVITAGLTQAFSFLKNEISNGIKAFADYEMSVIRLAKITNLPVESQERLVKSLQQVSIQLGVAQDNLIQYATVAASAGVRGEAALKSVAETLAKIQLATPLAGEAAAQSILRILNLTGEGAAGIQNFGNILAELGDNASITENEIVAIAEELSRVGSIFGLTATDVQVLATSFGETGASAELARTATLEFYTNLQKALTENNKTLPVFQRLIGGTKEEIKSLLQTNPAEVFIRFTKAAKDYKDQNGDLGRLLASVGIEEKRNVTTLGALISKYEVLDKNIGLANEQLITQDKLNNEAEKSSKSLASALVRQEGIYALISQTIGSILAPVIKFATDALVSFVEYLESSSTAMAIFQGVIVVITAIITVFIAKLALMALGLAVGAGAFATLGVVAAAAWAAVAAPITLVVAAIAGVIFVIAKLTGGWQNLIDKVREWVGLGKVVSKENKTQEESLDKQNKKLDEQAKKVNEAAKAKLKASQEGAKDAGKLTEAELAEIEKRAKTQKEANKRREEEQKRHAEEMKKLQEQMFKDQAQIVAINTAIDGLRQGKQAQLLQTMLGQNTQYFDSLKLLRMQAEVDEIMSEEGKRTKIMEISRMAAEEKFKLVQEERTLNQETELLNNQIALNRSTNLQAELDNEIKTRSEFLTKKEEIEFQAMLNAAKTEEQRAKIIGQIKKKAADNELKIEETKKQAILDSSATLFGAIASLARSGSKQNLQIFKAAATAQALISTYSAINRAMAELPFPANYIQAAAVGIQGFANVRNIQNTGNFEQGGIVPGNSFSGDRLTANVNSGEMILNRQQQSSLFSQINGGTQSGQPVTVHTTVNIDGETVARAVSKQVANGFQLGEVQ
jgi:TP901 family phage tail tape measure protein